MHARTYAPDDIITRASRCTLRCRELPVSRGSGMQDERPRVANIRQVGEQMTSFYNFDPIVVPSLQPKRENRAPVTCEI